MKTRIHYILLLLSLLIVAAISLANMQSIEVSFLLGSFRLPLIILILISVLLGSLITFLIGLPKNFSMKKRMKELEKTAPPLQEKDLS
ncbi:hypothetical protein STRDD10_00014 [Streptococcus sp. DD10]|uniref:lipopolysaccharide assembly protein LapA domain-containing protein n=1 Tax=Streptococcus sp. DD10 TaxID=1777878 RepID=UPI00079A0660|nr:lipopolysaccharide assembly protein LapA domain-containing protein [Streptococcus sp. DD10]KXT77375.1 hypothetical protein STRDD10_00014 [Streptococcus sp. DD10]